MALLFCGLLQRITIELQLQIVSVKTKYLAPFHFADTGKLYKFLDTLNFCDYLLLIGNSRKFVVFHDITSWWNLNSVD
jgi:hypothetical protein